MAALDRLKSMTAWNSVPPLSADDLDELLTAFSIEDADGNAPTSEDWTPTYSLRAAAAEGWRWKAAKAADLTSSDLDGDRVSADQVFDHCQRMIKTFASTASPAITTSLAQSE